MNEPKPIKLIAQLNRIVTTADGGSKITLDCGIESLENVLQLQRLVAGGDVSLAVAIVIYESDPFEKPMWSLDVP